MQAWCLSVIYGQAGVWETYDQQSFLFHVLSWRIAGAVSLLRACDFRISGIDISIAFPPDRKTECCLMSSAGDLVLLIFHFVFKLPVSLSVPSVAFALSVRWQKGRCCRAITYLN